ncbi:cardiolipin synthetase [Paraphoma chrysanthemicola]|uniref:Cardiolipin synthetase n=1 Tax=Paraphoma chrysanthemicola TaxID=798071 RepID=A0A8K0R6M4_9PLEO|nr:cardiolipin synthetase [Paraphoma chrysanthemicola]
MAGARKLPMTAVFALQSPIELCALPRLARIGQIRRHVYSRASCSWARRDVITRSNPCAILRSVEIRHAPRLAGFSTCCVRRSKQEEGASTSKQIKETPPTTTNNLATTLKSKLKLPVVKHENIYNLPNFLTLTRLIATPIVGYLIIHNHHLYAFSLFTYAAVSDLLDGWIARKWKLQTVVGSVVDPMADKFLMTTLITCLAVNGSLPMPLFVLILGRDASLAISALYYRYASLPAPKTMARYWDFSLPSAEVHPTTISKFNTFLQLSLLGTLLCTNLLHDPSATTSAAGGLLMSIQDTLGGEAGVRTLVQGMSAVVATTTVYSGLEYTWSKKAVVILGGDEALKRKQGFRGRMIMASGFGSFIALAAWLWYNEAARKEAEETVERK